MSKIKLKIYEIQSEKDIEKIKNKNNLIVQNLIKFYKTERKYFTKELDEIVEKNEEKLKELTHKFYEKLKNYPHNPYLPFFLNTIEEIPGGLSRPGYFTGYNFLVQRILGVNIFRAILFHEIGSSVEDSYFYKKFVLNKYGYYTGLVGTYENGDNYLKHDLIEKKCYFMDKNGKLALSRQKFLEDYEGFYKFLYEIIWQKESKDIAKEIDKIVNKNKDKLSFYYKKINPIRRSLKEFYFYIEAKLHYAFEIKNIFGLEKKLTCTQKYALEKSISEETIKDFWKAVKNYYIFGLDDSVKEEIYFNLYKNSVAIFSGRNLNELHNIIGCYKEIYNKKEQKEVINLINFLDGVERNKEYAVEFFEFS